MRRYELKSEIMMERGTQGTWVKFEDAQFEINKLENEIKILKISRDYFKHKKRSLSGGG